MWDNQLDYTWSWLDDCDMDRLLRKEDDTRVFRLARQRMSKRRGWMLKSRAFKLGMKPLRIGSLRVCTCYHLFSSSWQRHYSNGMRRKRAAQSTWRRFRFWMERSPCLWKSFRALNITISLSDLISVLDSHPEWFSVDGTCLEVIRLPLRRIGSHISHVPLSLVPPDVLSGSKEHSSKYLFWRMSRRKVIMRISLSQVICVLKLLIICSFPEICQESMAQRRKRKIRDPAQRI